VRELAALTSLRFRRSRDGGADVTPAGYHRHPQLRVGGTPIAFDCAVANRKSRRDAPVTHLLL
jgi:hypothetical protein